MQAAETTEIASNKKEVLIASMKHVDENNRGVSFMALKKYIVSAYNVDWDKQGTIYKNAFTKALEDNVIKRARKHGPGSKKFKIVTTAMAKSTAKKAKEESDDEEMPEKKPMSPKKKENSPKRKESSESVSKASPKAAAKNPRKKAK